MRRLYQPLAYRYGNSFISTSLSTEFFQLFGRYPTPNVVPGLDLKATAKAEQNDSKNPDSVWKGQLATFENELYSNPNYVDGAVCSNTLKCLHAFLSFPAHRKLVSAKGLWEHAIRVLSVSPSSSGAGIQNSIYVGFILYYSRKYIECKKLVESELNRIHKRQVREGLSSLEYQASLQLLTLYVVASMQSRHEIDSKTQRTTLSLLSDYRSVMDKTVDKDERWHIAYSIQFLLYSYDWVYHYASAPNQSFNTGLEKTFLTDLTSLAPKWVRGIFKHWQQSPKEITAQISEHLNRCPPSLFVYAGRQAGLEGDIDSLSTLLQHAIKREESFPNMTLFDVSVCLAEIYFKVQKRHDKLAQRVVDYVGTSLSTEALTAVGATSWGYQKSLYWITKMRGPEAYFSLKKVLFHKDPTEFAQLQTSCGDLLTGRTQANWKSALIQIQSSLLLADVDWRRQLPTTLRLLSDAGRKKEFFDLIREYDSTDKESNLMVAASLAQMIRRTGKWHYYTEVLDLIASSHVPKTDEGDMFLQDACLQTMYALRNAHRWEEAFSTYSMMRPVMPPQVHRLLCFMVCDMPPSSPWQTVLDALSAVAPIPPECKQTLACMYADSDQVPQAPHQRKYALRGFIKVRRWEALLKLAQSDPDDVEVWLAFFKAAEASESVVSHEASLLRRVPLRLWQIKGVLIQAFLSSLANGYLCELDVVLSEISLQCPLSNEVRELINFILYLRPSKKTLISDSYLGHCFTSFISSFDRKIGVRVDENVLNKLPITSTDRRRELAAWFRVPEFCIARVESGHDTSYYIRPFPLLCALPKQVLYTSDELLVAYKPPGVSIQSVAEGVLRCVGARGVYRIGYLIAPGSSGLFLLRKASLGIKGIQVNLSVEMEVMRYSHYALPLLSTSFFERYKMVFIARNESNGVVKLSANLFTAPLASVNDRLRSLKADLNSEGWSFVEQDVGFGDSYCVKKLSVLELCSGAHLSVSLPFHPTNQSD